MKSEILRILKNADDYISGQYLCEYFEVSRTAVWKAIEQLKKSGYDIEAVRNKGYRLVSQTDILSADEIESRITTSAIGQNIIYYKETDSTNIQAKKLGEAGAPSGTLVVSDKQESGRGRRGKGWISSSDDNIYMTLLLYPDILPNLAPMLTLVMALSVSRAISSNTGLQAGIKWPNDIVINGKKVCGILTEMSAQSDYINYVVIGVGINVNGVSFPKELQDSATSLKAESGKTIFRAKLIGDIMKEFETCYNAFISSGSLYGLKDEYNKLLVNKDKEVMVLDPLGEYRAYGIGINDTGELLVRLADGTIKEVYAGEVSVRGVYGYV